MRKNLRQLANNFDEDAWNRCFKHVVNAIMVHVARNDIKHIAGSARVYIKVLGETVVCIIFLLTDGKRTRM